MCYDIAQGKPYTLYHASLLARSRHPSGNKGQQRGRNMNMNNECIVPG